MGLPRWLSDKKSACNGLILRLGRSPGEENDNPLQYPCQENSMDRREQGHKELDMTEWLTLVPPIPIISSFESKFFLSDLPL